MTIELEPLNKAIERLTSAVERHSREPADDMVRDSVIQRFEFTYDLSHKMLRRVLEATMGDSGEVAQMTFPTLIRTGWEQGLVAGGWLAWEEYRKLRNTTSHTYDEAKAILAVSQIPDFLEDVRALAKRLAERVSE